MLEASAGSSPKNHAGGIRINHLPGARDGFRLSSEKRDQLARRGGIRASQHVSRYILAAVR